MCQYIFIKKDNFIMLKQLDGSTLLDFKNFTHDELLIFMSITQKAALNKSKYINIDIQKLFKELELENKSDVNYILDRFASKCCNIHVSSTVNGKRKRFALFQELEYDPYERKLTLEVNPKYLSILVKMYKDWTAEEIELYNNLSSDYNRSLYTLLKYSNGEYVVELDFLKNFLFADNMPRSYELVGKFIQTIITPAIGELTEYFPELKVEKIRTSRNITHLKFTYNKKASE